MPEMFAPHPKPAPSATDAHAHGVGTPVTIVLCTYQGQAYLAEQLDSLAAQTHRAWSLFVSDDGSQDGTQAILDTFARTHGAAHDIRRVRGPGRGAAANFLSALCHRDLPPGHVALSDQDDVWAPDKLARGMSLMARAAASAPGTPQIHGAQSLHVDADLKVIGASRPPRRPACFANALTQNVISGHSMILSPEAMALVRAAGPVEVPHHDWWLTQLITGAGGMAIIDDRPVLSYRQHGGNVMGAHQGHGAARARIGKLFDRTYGTWLRSNVAALRQNTGLLCPQARDTLDQVIRALDRPGPLSALGLHRAGLHRQTRGADLLFYLAAACGRI